MTVRVRIAPSPTGDPHVGTAYIGLINYAFARRHGGKFILRVEDTDQTRCTPQSQQAIMDSLRWLGLTYDEGPDVGGDYGPYIQSQRVGADPANPATNRYRRYAEQLVAQGDAYYCFCTDRELDAMRKRQASEGMPIMYDRRHRGVELSEARERIARGDAHVIRMKIPLEGEHVYKDRLRKQPVVKAWKEIDDQVILKSDGWPTYHLAAVVDDHEMAITHVIRAEEWLNSLPKHTLLYKMFGWTAPEFIHVGLLRNADKSKISKRKNPTNLLWYKHEGYLPAALLNFLALLGHSLEDGREKFTLDELCAVFDIDRINVTGPVFDMTKLKSIQGQYLRELPHDALKAEVLRCLDVRLDELLPLCRDRMVFGGDLLPQVDFLFADKVAPSAEDLVPKSWTIEIAKQALTDIQQRYKDHTGSDKAVWDAPTLEAITREFALKHWPDAEGKVIGAQQRNLFMVIRVAIAGRKESLPLFESLAALGALKVLERLGGAQLRLNQHQAAVSKAAAAASAAAAKAATPATPG